MTEPPLARYSAIRDSLLAADRARGDALGRGLTAAMGEFLDARVIYLRGGAHVAYGNERAMALIAAIPPGAPTFTGWQPIGAGVSRDRLSGYTFGIAVRSGPGGAAMIERYVAYWVRAPGAPWRIAGYVEVSPGRLSSATGTRMSPAMDTGAMVRAVFAADSAFAERASLIGPAAAARDALADDGVLLTTTQLVVGPRAATEYLESRNAFSVSWVPRGARVAGSGDLGFTIGEALSTSAGPTGAATQHFTKYLTVWRREADGRWRVVVTGANDRPSPISD